MSIQKAMTKWKMQKNGLVWKRSCSRMRNFWNLIPLDLDVNMKAVSARGLLSDCKFQIVYNLCFSVLLTVYKSTSPISGFHYFETKPERDEGYRQGQAQGQLKLLLILLLLIS